MTYLNHFFSLLSSLLHFFALSVVPCSLYWLVFHPFRSENPLQRIWGKKTLRIHSEKKNGNLVKWKTCSFCDTWHVLWWFYMSHVVNIKNWKIHIVAIDRIPFQLLPELFFVPEWRYFYAEDTMHMKKRRFIQWLSLKLLGFLWSFLVRPVHGQKRNW